MADYSTWPTEKVKISNIDIDSLNPRLSSTEANLSQNELLNEMVKNYRIYDLAKSITQDGFFPDKRIIVFRENKSKQFTVLEGNRRVTAIKILLNPDIVETSDIEKFRKLSNLIDKKQIELIDVVIAPSREAANPILFKEHTQNTSMSWSRLMQAEFYVRQIENGHNVDNIQKTYNIPKSEILTFLRLYNMHDLATKQTGLSSKAFEIIADKQNFPASVLERVYDSPLMKTFLKIDFNDKGEVTGQTSKESFQKAFKVILEDIANESINTRVLNREEDFRRYIDKIKDAEPKTAGSFTQGDFSEKALPKKKAIPAKKKTSSARTTKSSNSIISSGVPFTLKGASNLKKHYDELRSLSIKDFPNTSGIMLRAFVDKSLRFFLKKNKLKTLPILSNGVTKNVKIDDVSLGDMFDHLIKKDIDLLDDNLKKVVRQFKNAGDKSSLSALNSLAHNEVYSLNEKEVGDIGIKLEPLIKTIIEN